MADRRSPNATPPSGSEVQAGAPKRKLRVIVASVAVVVLIVGAGLAAYAYVRATSRLAPSEADAAGLKRELNAATAGPTYVLVLGDDRRPGQERGQAEAVLLVRVDGSANRATVLAIPGETVVSGEASATSRISRVYSAGGAPAVIQEVKELTGLPVHHFIQLDFEGLVHAVDAMGGIRMTVDGDVDNSYLGQPAEEVIRLRKGSQLLSGIQVLVYLKDRGESGRAARRTARQQEFITALIAQAGSKQHLAQLPGIADAMSQNMKTDMSMPQLLDLAATFRKIPKSSIVRHGLPGKDVGTGDTRPFVPDTVKARQLFDAIRENGGSSEASSGV